MAASLLRAEPGPGISLVTAQLVPTLVSHSRPAVDLDSGLMQLSLSAFYHRVGGCVLLGRHPPAFVFSRNRHTCIRTIPRVTSLLYGGLASQQTPGDSERKQWRDQVGYLE
jgi:hypothetical protein